MNHELDAALADEQQLKQQHSQQQQQQNHQQLHSDSLSSQSVSSSSLSSLKNVISLPLHEKSDNQTENVDQVRKLTVFVSQGSPAQRILSQILAKWLSPTNEKILRQQLQQEQSS